MGNTDSMQREHSAESIAVGEWAANLILKNVFDSIDEKEKFGKDMRSDTSTEGPEPEPPVDEDCPKTGRPTVAGRPIPSPLQDDPTWAGHKEEEGAKSAAPPVLVTPAEQSPEAGAPQCWPQTPQSPVTQAPMDPAAFYGAWGYGGAVAPPAAPFGAFPPGANSFGNSFNAGFNAGFAGVFNGGFGGAGAAPPAHPNVLGNAAVQGWGGGGCNNACGGVACGPNNVPGYNPYAPFGSYAWHQYGGYGGFPPAPAPQGPNGPNQDMRQAYYPQANSQAQWTQGGQAFFQPFSTQPPVHPAMQQYAPPPAAPQYPPQQPQQPQQRAPLQAQFSNAPLLNTQPFQQQQPPPPAYPQMPAMRPPAAPTAAPPTVAPSVAPTVPPAAVQPVQPLAPSQPAPSAPPVIPTVQAARAAKPPSPVHTKEERRQAAEEVLAQQRAWVAMLSRARDESAENRPSEASTAVTTPAAAAVATSASASTAELKPNEATSSAQPASPTPSTEETQAKSSSKASTWAPKIAPRKGSGKGGVWVAKDSSKGGGKSAAKGNGKGKGKGKGLVYRPKHEVSEETNERRQKKRGKMNEYSYGY